MLLPRILAFNKIQAQNKGVFYQCNWTAWLQRALLLELSDLFIVPDTISLCPSLTFLFLSAFDSPACRRRFSSLRDPPPVSQPLRGSSFIVLSPPFSFLLSCLLMGSVSDMLLEGVMHYRSRGYEKKQKKKKKIPRPQSSQGYNAQKNHLPPKLWCPTRPTSSVSSKYRFPSKRRTSRIWNSLDWERRPFKGRSCWCFLPWEGRRPVLINNNVLAEQTPRKTERRRRARTVGTCSWPQAEQKKWHPLCILSYLKMTRIHFSGIQYVMSYDLYVLYCSYSSL